MPVFGARMVCETADVKHIQRVQKDTLERETRLGQWADEKVVRLRRLKDLKQFVTATKANLDEQSLEGQLTDLTQPPSSPQLREAGEDDSEALEDLTGLKPVPSTEGQLYQAISPPSDPEADDKADK